MTNSSSLKRGGGIAEVVDEILSRDVNAAGLAVHYHLFGSNDHETADYSRGVLQRFTRRAPNDWYIVRKTDDNKIESIIGNCYVKNIVDPRKINFFHDPHTMNYIAGYYGVDEKSNRVADSIPLPITADNIVLNHYHVKSREEYAIKHERGDVVDPNPEGHYTQKQFDILDRNEVFDDGILRYAIERAKTFRPPDKSRADERLLDALVMNLSPTLFPNTPKDFYRGKFETFLTCRAVAAYLNEKHGDDIPAKFFEEAALKAIIKSLQAETTLGDAQLLIRELPNLLKLSYPVVKEIRFAALEFIGQMRNVMHVTARWKDFVELGHLAEILKL